MAVDLLVGHSLETKFFVVFFARVCDYSFGTLRSMSVVQGRKLAAWCFGFLEFTLWIWVVAQIIKNLEHPILFLAFAAGAATGNVIGMYIEQWMAFGERILRIFSRQGDDLADRLREEGFFVSEFQGEGRDGPVCLLFIDTKRKLAKKAIKIAREFDPNCFVMTDTANVRSFHAGK